MAIAGEEGESSGAMTRCASKIAFGKRNGSDLEAEAIAGEN